MNREDIIRMEREACPYTTDEMRGAFYEGFIKGAAAEREECAKVLDHMADEMAREMEPSTAVAWVRSKAASIRARGQA